MGEEENSLVSPISCNPFEFNATSRHRPIAFWTEHTIFVITLDDIANYARRVLDRDILAARVFGNSVPTELRNVIRSPYDNQNILGYCDILKAGDSEVSKDFLEEFFSQSESLHILISEFEDKINIKSEPLENALKKKRQIDAVEAREFISDNIVKKILSQRRR